MRKPMTYGKYESYTEIYALDILSTWTQSLLYKGVGCGWGGAIRDLDFVHMLWKNGP